MHKFKTLTMITAGSKISDIDTADTQLTTVTSAEGYYGMFTGVITVHCVSEC